MTDQYPTQRRDQSEELDDEIQVILKLGNEYPMSPEEVTAQLRRIFGLLQKEGGQIRDDQGRAMDQDEIEATIQSIAAGGD